MDMSQRSFIISLLVIILLTLAWTTNVVQASFGISPPTVHNPNLLPGSHYEQEIRLLRGNPDNETNITATIMAPDFPEIKSWISIDKGTSFTLPKGVFQVPIVISIDVPKNAKHQEYLGYIDVKTESTRTEPGVGIALGARIQIVLGVGDRPVPNFKVQAAEMLSTEECCSIKYAMTIENTGNVKTRPSKVELTVFHGYMKEKLLHVAEVEDKDLAWVGTNETKEIIAKFPIKLEPGRYWSQVHILKAGKVERTDRMFFTIAPGKKILGLTFCLCNLAWVVIKFILFLAIIYSLWRWLGQYKISKK